MFQIDCFLQRMNSNQTDLAEKRRDLLNVMCPLRSGSLCPSLLGKNEEEVPVSDRGLRDYSTDCIASKTIKNGHHLQAI